MTTGNRCRLEERFGAEVKPFIYRLFPFLLILEGHHWRVGMRFSCPSAAANPGRPVVDAKNELTHLSRLLEHCAGRSAESASPPFLQGRHRLSRPDPCRVVEEFPPEIRFEEVEQRIGTLPEIDETLERFYAVKLKWPGLAADISCV